MTQISRRAALVAVAAVAGAGVALPAATPLGRLADGATSATPDPVIDVGYRIEPMDRPREDATETSDPASGSEPTADAGDTDPTAPANGRSGRAAGGAGSGAGGGNDDADTTTTVEVDPDGGTRLLTAARTGPVTFADVAPGERGTLTMGVDVGDAPVRIALRTVATDDENGVGESEAAAGDTTPAAGELADFLAVTLTARTVPAGAGASPAAPTHTLYEGTLAGLLAAADAAGDGLEVPGDRPDGTCSPGATCDLLLSWAFLGDESAFDARGLAVPGDVNRTQSDRLDVALDVTARTLA
ncbi:hypothetical protein [Halobaculum lipolyticum]|uniref:Uncharacterized protein n=1 Tax=Halobaculum lipolyticum TaxID=3032001 RepID=A0ABD5W8Q6_9EURY|nr:hypothetical protein [Halobaculum sp. DT31]